jgi:hypothetical protein
MSRTYITYGAEFISFIQIIRPRPRLLVIFRNKLIFYGEQLLASLPTPKLEAHPLSAVRDCLFNIIAATLHIWRPSPPSATWGRAIPWWFPASKISCGSKHEEGVWKCEVMFENLEVPKWNWNYSQRSLNCASINITFFYFLSTDAIIWMKLTPFILPGNS